MGIITTRPFDHFVMCVTDIEIAAGCKFEDLAGHRVALQRAGQALSERVHRALQRAPQGRVLERNDLHEPHPCPPGAASLAA